VSSTGITGPLLFGVTITGTSYLQILLQKIMLCINEMYTNEECNFQQARVSSYYHNNVTDFLNTHLSGRWVEHRKCTVLSWSHNLTSTDLSVRCSKEHWVCQATSNTGGVAWDWICLYSFITSNIFTCASLFCILNNAPMSECFNVKEKTGEWNVQIYVLELLWQLNSGWLRWSSKCWFNTDAWHSW